jgi:hypothetical protein
VTKKLLEEEVMMIEQAEEIHITNPEKTYSISVEK